MILVVGREHEALENDLIIVRSPLRRQAVEYPMATIPAP